MYLPVSCIALLPSLSVIAALHDSIERTRYVSVTPRAAVFSTGLSTVTKPYIRLPDVERPTRPQSRARSSLVEASSMWRHPHGVVRGQRGTRGAHTFYKSIIELYVSPDIWNPPTSVSLSASSCRHNSDNRSSNSESDSRAKVFE